MSTTYGAPRTKGRKRVIAIITVAMMIVSILSLTIWAAAEDAYYTTVAEAPSEYAPNEPPSSDTESDTSSESDGEYGSEQESNESDSSVPDGNTDGGVDDGIAAESPDGNSSDDYQCDDSFNANESEDEYEYGNEDYEEKLCTCECEYYCDYDCICECEDCCVEIEALADFVVKDWDALYDAFTTQMTTDGPYIISVTSSITMEAKLNIPTGRIVNLTGGGVLYQPTADARHFGVDGTLVLENIRLSGMLPAIWQTSGGVFVNSTGRLYLLNGSIISNNRAMAGGGIYNNGVLIMYGGIIHNNFGFGGGIYISNGTFTMYGGAIRNNSGAMGGGVFNDNNGIFTMNDGEISGNRATGHHGGGGGIYNLSYFVMNGGRIYNNRGEDWGGGVLNTNVGAFRGASFTMNGGIISSNNAGSGGGVAGGGDFTKYGGEISGNMAGHGGGVSPWGTFTMHDGYISGNYATYGGGIIVGSFTVVTIYGGIISGNTATYGGGLSVAASPWATVHPLSTLTISSEVVFSNNTATSGLRIDDSLNREHNIEANGRINPGTWTTTLGNPNNAHAFNNHDIRTEFEVIDNPQSTWTYRNIRMYYYLEDFGFIINDTDNNSIGRNYLRRANYLFDLSHVADRNELASNSAYVFEGWRIYVDDVYNAAYITDKNMNELRGSFTVPVYMNADEYVYGLVGDTIALVAVWSIFEVCDTNCEEGCKGYSYCGTPCVCECDDTHDPEYRSIRIYYYILENDALVRDIENNTLGRQYFGRVGDPFDLGVIGVLDRNELDSDDAYVFEGWRVYVGDVHSPTYLTGKNLTAIHGSFVVPNATNAMSQEEYIIMHNDFGAGETISLVAVWSVYDANEDDNDNNGDTGKPENDEDDSDKKLPQTGVESNMLLWSALLVLVLVAGLDTITKIKRNKDD